MPDVRGSPSRPRRRSSRRSASPSRGRTPTSDQAEGTVIDQTPAPNNVAPKGSTVTLTVSKGPTTTGVPNVEGDRRADRAQPAGGVRVQGAGRAPGHGRRGAGRLRAQSGSAVGYAGETGLEGDDRRGPLPGAAARRHDDRHDHRPASRDPAAARGRARRRPVERARHLARLRALGARGARSRALRRGDGRDRPRRPLGARSRPTRMPWVRPGGAACRDIADSDRRRPDDARPTSTSCCRSCTARSARTEPCRGCSSSRMSPTSVPASPPRRSAWTRTCSRR